MMVKSRRLQTMEWKNAIARVTRPVLSVALLLAVNAGCLDMTVDSAYRPGIDASAIGSSFAWRPGPWPSTGDPTADDLQVQARIRNTVERHMAEKGYQKVPAEKADLWLDFLVGRRLQPDPYRVTFAQYELGWLMLNITDRKTNQAIWRAAADARLDESVGSLEERDKVTDEAVRRMLDRFVSANRSGSSP
jgi:hypothetical protein